ncbi:hypothetical protein [Amycolatopsis sp. cmx-8-4]|uniref:hypothetical protein n=1 Tax=Amycolatopsis sp. cmx-8-4 TaxID=2790947 RepID=UPI003979B85A
MNNTDDVSPGVHKALRDATQRLLAGRSKHTDGRLTKANLGREAGVSHATLYRAKAALTEWDEAIAALGTKTIRSTPVGDADTTLQIHLAQKTDECAELRRRLEAAATVIATLHHENTALRQQVSRGDTVVPITSRDRTTGQAASPFDARQTGRDGDAR